MSNLILVDQGTGTPLILFDTKQGPAGPNGSSTGTANILWVSLTGSDTTGNGSLGSPFATYGHAATVAIAGGAGDVPVYNAWVVMFAPGTYLENIHLQPWVNLCGIDAYGSTELNGTITLGSGYTGAGSTLVGSGISSATINGNVNLNFLAANAHYGWIQFFDVFFEGSWSAEGFGPSNEMGLLSCAFNYGCTASDIDFSTENTIVQGGIVVNSPTYGAALNTQGGTFDTITLNGATNSCTALMNGTGVSGAVTLNGSLTSYNSTLEGVGASVTRTGGAAAPVITGGGAGTSGQVPTCDGAGHYTFTTPSAGVSVTGTGIWYSASGALNAAAVTPSKDVSVAALSGSNYPFTVIGIQGSTLPSLSAGFLRYNGSNFVYTAITTALLPNGTAAQILQTNAGATAAVWTTMSGDGVIGATGVLSVTSIHGTTVPAGGSLTTGNQLIVSGASAATWAALNLAGGAGYVSGTLPLGNVGSPTGTGVALVSGGAWVSAAGTVNLASATYVSGLLGVANFGPGTSGQVLMSNATPATTWTTLSGGATISATGVVTVAALTMGGDVTGTTAANTVVQLTGSSSVVNALNGVALDFLTTGSPTATSGRINFAGGAASTLISVRNAANTTDYQAFHVDGADDWVIGTASNAAVAFKGGFSLQLLGGASSESLTLANGATTASFTTMSFTGGATYFAGTSNVTIGGTTADFGGGAGILSFAAATTIPTSFPSTSIGVYNATGQTLGLNSKGVLFPSTVAAAIAFSQTALGSTAGSTGSNGQALSFTGQAGQATSATSGTGGTGASNTLSGGAGGIASGTTSTGGPGGNAIVNGGAGASGTSTNGANGLAALASANTTLLDVGANGLRMAVGALTIATSGNTTVSAALLVNPLLQIASVTLVGAASITFPNARGTWFIDIGNVAGMTNGLTFKSGSASSPVQSAVVASSTIIMIQTYGSNQISINV